ncbi:MAG TPA: LLM class flavin-dependent oxidoreductase [Ktedonobacteraceae bacterium]|nr:LLM class flavin-dependent oxidoreductase [Ktedonobacteraceae bacterium]
MTQSTSARKMKIGIVLETAEGGLDGKTPTFHQVQEMAQAAERAGLDSIWLCDHLIYRSGQEEAGFWEVFSILSALAAVTTRITLGTIVVCTSFRPPALVAKMADTIDEISGGRLILGLGAGWHQPEYEAFGYPFDHLAGRFEEAMQIIAPLLREGKVDFQGQYYQVHNCVLRPRGPSRQGPPILIAGRRPRMLQLTARYGDAWNTAWHIEPAVVKEQYEEFKQACAVVGRDPAAIELTVGTAVKFASPGEEVDPKRAISGSPEAIASHLQRFAEEGVTHLIVILDQLSLENIEQFGHIVELLRQQ